MGAGFAEPTLISAKVAPVTHADMVASVELVGNLIPCRRSVIVSEIDGVILEVPASSRERVEFEINGKRVSEAPRLNIGIDVAQDDVLVQLDPTQYELKLQAAVARLNSAMREAEYLYAWRRPEEIRRDEAEKQEAEARVSLAELNLARAQELIGRNAIAQASLDQRETDLKTAKAALERADAELALARAGPSEPEIAVAKAAIAQAQVEVDRAKWELEKTTIRAPYDGVVTDRYVDDGDRVTAMPRVEIMELMDVKTVTAQLCVPERYVNLVQVGDPARVFIKGQAESLRGAVCLVNDKVDPANRTFRIRVAIPNEQRRLKVGQFARVELQIASSPDTLTVPASAITHAGGEAQVFVCRDGRVQRRAVVLGLTNDEVAEVLSGLTAGEQVVVDDPSILSDGMSVQVSAANTTAASSASVP